MIGKAISFGKKVGRGFSNEGIYSVEKRENELAGSMAIITTEANDLVAEIHNTKKRMPVILPEERMQEWIDPESMRLTEIGSFLQQYPEDRMEAYPVSKAVGSPSAQGEELTMPLEEQDKLL